jgi:hypothetical protein
MQKFLKQLWSDIQHGENVDLIVTVSLVLIISVLNALGIASVELVSSITLATLGLIAVGLLVTRYRLDEIRRKENSFNTVEFSGEKPVELTKVIGDAREIWMIGLTLRGTTTGYFHDFKKKAEKGARFHVMIVNLDKINLEPMLRRFSRGGNAEQFKADFRQTLNQYKQIGMLSKNPDYVQVRLLDFVPSYSAYIFPHAGDGGIAYVEIFGYKSPRGSVPRFCISEKQNPEWYQHFVSQFEIMWNDAYKPDL